MEQRSVEWFNQRRGRFTASQIYKLMGKKPDTETALTYIKSKAAETICDSFPAEITSKEMAHGIEFEETAKVIYEQKYNELVLNHGFKIAFNDNAGCSPDGLIAGKEKGIEIKCPYTIASHLENLLIFSGEDLKSEKPEYYWQVQMCMLCFGYEKWDYVSFSPYFQDNYKLISIEIHRNESDINFLSDRILWAIDKKQEFLKKIK